jgi:hypothetical protein
VLGSGRRADKWLAELDGRERRDRWVTAICDRAEELDREQQVQLLTALYQWGDRHEYEQGRFPTGEHYSWNEMVGFCSTAILKSLGTSGEKIALLRDVISQSKAVISPGLVVGMEYSRQRKDGYGHWSHGTDLAEFVTDLESEISQLALSYELWTAPDPDEVLHAWAYLNDEASRQWHDSLPDDLGRFAKYLNHIVGPQMHDKNRLGWEVGRKRRSACEAVDVSLLTEEGRWAREFFLESASESRTDESAELDQDT